LGFKYVKIEVGSEYSGKKIESNNWNNENKDS
jgi:hypothetical protein